MTEKEITNIIAEAVCKVLLKEGRGHHYKQGFDPKHRANSVKLGYDPNLRYGDDFVKNGGNFMVVRNGRQYYVSRNTSVSLYAFARDSKGQWCILANERGKGGGRGLYNVTCGFVDMAPNGKPEETLEQAACREAFEENGVKIDPSKLVMMGVNSKNTNINASFYTVITDRTVEQMPTSAAGAEGGEVLDTRWIPLSEVNKYKFAFNQNAKIPAIAKKALGNYEVEGDKRVETLIALLKNKIGNDQEGQYLLSQIIKELTKKKT